MYDYTYWIFSIPAILLAVISQIWISTSYAKNSKIIPGTGLTGEQAGNMIKAI